MSSRRTERGAALVVALVAVLVITAAGVAVIRFSTREVSGATAARKAAATSSCAEAARAYLMSQWKLLGSYGTAVPPLNVLLDGTAQTRILGGHYDEDPTDARYWDGHTWLQNVQVVRLDPLTVGSSYQVNDITNRIGDSVQPYRVVAHCLQASEGESLTVGGRQVEVEFAVQFGL